MNQKIAFYLLSITAIFFIGYYYSQFNIEPLKPEIITINNKDEIEQYESSILSNQLQLEGLNNQLILSLDELKTTSQKLSLSLSKIQVLEGELSSIQDAYNLSVASLKKSNAELLKNKNTLKELKSALSKSELHIQTIKFDLEIAEALLKAK
ncbi:MAG: chromosome segregation ATPase [Candidatus Pseudothioglobus sp.]|jgi:chromosome segregation ATPase|tara:strand:- start:435 stop:890 length:456 start_codon:yes stop_codon:yes gene_type:complete